MTSIHNSQRCPIAGLYGIPGCGKSHLLSKLKTQLGEEKYVYHEESKVIGTVPAGDLCSQNTGELWWRIYRQHYPSDESDECDESDDSDKSDASDESDGSDGRECPLRRLFNGPLGYSYAAFRQAVFLYEEAADDQKFGEICEGVASNVNMHPEFINLLWHVFDDTCVKAVVVTSGIRLVWEKVLTRGGLSDDIKVVGGGRIKDTFVVTPMVKGALVDYLRKTLKAKVWAFGASRMDLGMLRNADQAFVVVGEEANRSITMDEALMDEFTNDRFRPKQVLLPPTSSPRLDTKVLPITTLDSQMFLDLLFCGSKRVTVIEATDTDAS